MKAANIAICQAVDGYPMGGDLCCWLVYGKSTKQPAGFS
jgi:hypothetical protein